MASVGDVMGCGIDPRKDTVYWTKNGELVAEVNYSGYRAQLKADYKAVFSS